MKKLKILNLSLSLFDGEGSSTAGEGNASTQGEVKSAVPGNTRRGKSGEFSNVVFGKQATDSKATNPQENATDTNTNGTPDAEENNTDVKETSSTPKDLKKAYSEMIKGEFKDVHTAEMQRIIDRRFSQTKTLEEKVNKSQPVIDMLMLRYNIEDGDMEKLKTALENDNAYYDEAAAEAGMEREQYKEFQRLKLQAKTLEQREKQRMGEESAREQLNKWYNEADAVKAKYPNFDINADVKNPQFLSLLRSGIPMEHAYKVLHMDEILSDAIQNTAIDTENRVVANVRAKGTRPVENGTQSQSAFIIKDDVSKLTKKDRAEIARRALNGDLIEF